MEEQRNDRITTRYEIAIDTMDSGNCTYALYMTSCTNYSYTGVDTEKIVID